MGGVSEIIDNMEGTKMGKGAWFLLAMMCALALVGCGSPNNEEKAANDISKPAVIEGTEKSLDTELATDYDEESQTNPVTDDSACWPGITYNEVDAVDTVAGFDVTGRKLTEEELEMVLPDILLDWMEPSGTALGIFRYQRNRQDYE